MMPPSGRVPTIDGQIIAMVRDRYRANPNWQIAQTSASFSGTLTAVDLDAKTVKAKEAFETKKFNLGDNCTIVINGKPDGKLSDLKPNDKLVFSYDEINGVNVATRTAPAEVMPRNYVVTEPANGF